MKSWFYTNGKRIGAFTLVFALVLTLCFSEGIGSLVTVLAGESAVWDGSTAKSYAGGRGTKDDPFQIATGEQLAKLATDGDSTAGNYYVLTNDIRLNDTTDADWTTNSPKQWVGGGNNETYFQGTLEGGGHTVSCLRSAELEEALKETN